MSPKSAAAHADLAEALMNIDELSEAALHLRRVTELDRFNLKHSEICFSSIIIF